MALMYQITTMTPAPPSSLCPELPRAFDELVAACLQKDPQRRPASAVDLAGQLGRLLTKGAQSPTRIDPARAAIAVLPFLFRTPAHDSEFLSIALADAVIHRLLSTGKLDVRPIAAVARYKGLEVDWSRVAHELNVDWVVDGSIQQIGPKLRVLVDVRRVAGGQTPLSAKHDGDAEDLFGLQDRIADSVSAVFVPIDKTSSHTAVPPTANALAYELYMRAIDRLANWNRFDLSAAIEMLTQAVELDPRFAAAWGQLAQAYSQMGMFLDPDPKWFALAETAIANTLESDALCARGFVLWSPSRGYQHRPALRAMNAALKLDPNRHNFRWFRGLILFHLGFYADVERDSLESLKSNPKYSIVLVALGKIAEYRGKYAEAAEYIDRALRLDSALVLANIFAPMNPLALGDIEEARRQLRLAQTMVPGESRLTAIEGLIAACEGNFKLAETLAVDASRQARSVTHTHHTWHVTAGIYALCGKQAEAIEELKRCAGQGLPNHHLFDRDPFLQGLKGHPDFAAMQSALRRAGDQFATEFDLAEGG